MVPHSLESNKWHRGRRFHGNSEFLANSENVPRTAMRMSFRLRDPRLVARFRRQVFGAAPPKPRPIGIHCDAKPPSKALTRRHWNLMIVFLREGPMRLALISIALLGVMLVGCSGPQGPQGQAGSKGQEGNAGVAGPAGAKGDRGPQGAMGPAGPQGSKGDLGQQGPQGAMDAAGPQGPKGDSGPQGATGPAGPAGPAAMAGLRVVTGAKSVACNQDEVLVSIVCSAGTADGTSCPSSSTATGLCMRK